VLNLADISEYMPEIVKLNLEGEVCPYPLIMSIKKGKEIKKDLEAGKKVLEIIIDHPPSLETIPLRFKKEGFLVKTEKIGAAKWKIIIKK